MKLSILVPTHKRPEKFKECLKSIKQFKFPFGYEILVNNDSNDIEEEYDDVKYFYNNFELYQIYQFLYDSANGEYVYILEDDDLLLEGFIEVLNDIDSSDLHVGLYDIESNKVKIETLMNMIKKQDFKYFQMGQMLFKKIPLEFPTNNHVENDEVLFNNLKQIFKPKYHKKYFFKQRIFGDNISYRALKELL
jgi:glycosyltransferase involved in cell wall biosynthesis